MKINVYIGGTYLYTECEFDHFFFLETRRSSNIFNRYRLHDRAV